MNDQTEEENVIEDAPDGNQNNSQIKAEQTDSIVNEDNQAVKADAIVDGDNWVGIDNDIPALMDFEDIELEALHLEDDFFSESIDIMEVGVTAGLSKVTKGSFDADYEGDGIDDFEALGLYDYMPSDAYDERYADEYSSWESKLDAYADLNHQMPYGYGEIDSEIMQNAAIHMELMIGKNNGQILDGMFKEIAETDFSSMGGNIFQSDYAGISNEYNMLQDSYPDLTTVETLMMLDRSQDQTGSFYKYYNEYDVLSPDYNKWDTAFKNDTIETNGLFMEGPEAVMINTEYDINWMSAWHNDFGFNANLTDPSGNYKYNDDFSFHPYLDDVGTYHKGTDFYASNVQIIELPTTYYSKISDPQDSAVTDESITIATVAPFEPSSAELATINNMNNGGSGIAESGIDTILVGKNASNDVIKGNTGEDIIVAQGGDTVTGGAGADKFIIASLVGGPVHLTDFEHGIDKILISGSGPNALNIDNLTASGSYEESYINGQVSDVDIGTLVTLDQLTNVNINTLEETFFEGSVPLSNSADQFILVNNILYFDESAGVDYMTVNDGLGHESIDFSDSARFIQVASFDGPVTIDASDIAIIADMSIMPVDPPIDAS